MVGYGEMRVIQWSALAALRSVRLGVFVIPAKAGIQWRSYKRRWIPAFAGMTAIL
jgi:hypothetical protein